MREWLTQVFMKDVQHHWLWGDSLTQEPFPVAASNPEGLLLLAFCSLSLQSWPPLPHALSHDPFARPAPPSGLSHYAKGCPGPSSHGDGHWSEAWPRGPSPVPRAVQGRLQTDRGPGPGAGLQCQRVSGQRGLFIPKAWGRAGDTGGRQPAFPPLSARGPPACILFCSSWS